MSVYFEAIQSGRINLADCSPTIGRSGTDGKPRLLNKGIKRQLREVKRAEAEERNAKTPGFRRASARREAAESIARFEAKKARRA